MLDHVSLDAAPVTGLVRYDAMCRAIAAAYEVDEVKDIHDRAIALEHYERLAKNVEAEDRCYQIRWRAARKAGELLKAMEKAKRGPNKDGGGHSQRSENSTSEKTLAELGISKQQSSDWQKLTSLPREEFETALREKNVSALLAAGCVTPVSDDALLFIGTMRDFDRRGYLARTPADFMATMTGACSRKVYQIARLPRKSNSLKLLIRTRPEGHEDVPKNSYHGIHPPSPYRATKIAMPSAKSAGMPSSKIGIIISASRACACSSTPGVNCAAAAQGWSDPSPRRRATPANTKTPARRRFWGHTGKPITSKANPVCARVH